MKTYYNEYDKKKCYALKQLMADGHISKGEIDDRPIQEVMPDDIKDYTRCHFFAGIGLWDYALELAGWEQDRHVWTGSCPCQPFSSAGRQKGKTDDRHLWPEWFRLIKKCGAATIFGEQVATAITKGWLDDVYQGLEAQNYAVGSVVLPASSVGAPHRRERLWFVAHAEGIDDRRNAGEFQKTNELKTQERQERRVAESSSTGTLGDTKHDGHFTNKVGKIRKEAIQHDTKREDSTCKFAGTGESGQLPKEFMGNSVRKRLEGHARHGKGVNKPRWNQAQQERPAWETGVWIDCPDGKKRLVECSFSLLVDGNTVSMASVNAACIQTVKEKVIYYGSKTEVDPYKILQMVQETYGTKTFHEWKASGLYSVYENEILFSFLQRISTTLKTSENKIGIKEAHAYDENGNMRSMYLEEVFGGTSYKWKPYEQFGREFTDPLFQLSFFLAQCAFSCEFASRNTHAASIPLLAKGQINRKSIIHCAGDAIVPQVAAEVIKAFMEIESI